MIKLYFFWKEIEEAYSIQEIRTNLTEDKLHIHSTDIFSCSDSVLEFAYQLQVTVN